MTVSVIFGALAKAVVKRMVKYLPGGAPGSWSLASAGGQGARRQAAKGRATPAGAAVHFSWHRALESRCGFVPVEP